MAKFCPLFSSSSGNCIYIGTSDGGILIDAGGSAKRITSALDSIGVSPESIGAIFITHEHSDHVNGLRVFAGSRNIDVYASAGTLGALDSMVHIKRQIHGARDRRERRGGGGGYM